LALMFFRNNESITLSSKPLTPRKEKLSTKMPDGDSKEIP